MASNRSSRSNFLSLVEDEFEASYLSSTGYFDYETQFVDVENTKIGYLGLEINGQNYTEDNFSGEPSQRVNFVGFDHQLAAGIQYQVNGNANMPQQNYHNVAKAPSTSSVPPPSENIDNSGSSSSNINNPGPRDDLKATDLLMAVSMSTDENKAKISDIASEAMEELRGIALVAGEPLWQLDQDKSIQTLNAVEYLKEFANIHVTLMELHKLVKARYEPLPSPWPGNTYSTAYFDPNDDFIESLTEGLFSTDQQYVQSPEDHLNPEASREVGYIAMKPEALVELLMDLELWSLMFSDIVSKPTLLGVLASNGVQGNYEGTLQVMKVEYYCPSPLVPTRESFIARYCKKINHGMWGVVDVSLERVLRFPSADNFRRRPSGCLIEEMPNGSSKVIWVEHVMVDNRQVHGILEPMVSSGFAFSAKRWLEILARQCERFSSPILPPTTNNPLVDAGLATKAAGRRSLMKLSERMVRSFGVEMSGSKKNKWTTTLLPNVSTVQDPTSMAIKSYRDDLIGTRPGTAIIFTTSLGLPTTPPTRIFDYLRDENSRFAWDIMSVGLYSIEEIDHISTSNRPGNRISLIKVKATPDLIFTTYLQESYTDSTGSYVVFSPLKPPSAAMILSGGNPDLVGLLPSGFIIHPDVSKMSGGVSSGSLLTIAHHCIDFGATPQCVPHHSISDMNNTLAQTAMAIDNAVAPRRS